MLVQDHMRKNACKIAIWIKGGITVNLFIQKKWTDGQISDAHAEFDPKYKTVNLIYKYIFNTNNRPNIVYPSEFSEYHIMQKGRIFLL